MESPQLPAGVAESLQAAGFQFTVAATGTVWLMRDNCAAIAQITPAGLGAPGSTALATEQGFGFVLWRDGQAYIAVKGSETAATPEQLATVQRFSADLKAALAL